MTDFRLAREDGADILYTSKKGSELLRDPLLNKGTGFTPEERREFGIEALLPAQSSDISTQAKRIYKSIFFNPDPVGRHIGLASLQDRNEVLFYRVLRENLESTMPVVYTPTVGKASEHYSRVFRRGRGVFITPEYRGRIEETLRRAVRHQDIRLMVVTDNESILGIGDQGVGGMAISIGKLALYCVGAGIHPAHTLPVSLDVGTNNEKLLADPLYMGWRHNRLEGDEYLALIDEFVAAVKALFPAAVVQWEDFRKDNALKILDRYRDQVPSFNDDIQGTGAVAAAGVASAARITGDDLRDSRILIYGAGAAGLGIARQLRVMLEDAGVAGKDLVKNVLVMDSRGVISDARSGLDAYKQELAWPAAELAALGLDGEAGKGLVPVISAYRPNVLIGASGQGGSFDEKVVAAMFDYCAEPVIMPMSNPTAISEAVPEDLYAWTKGRSLVATGSPFEAVSFDGKQHRVGQANNVFVFPGIGLGAIAAGATQVTDTMISASAVALANALGDDDVQQRCLMPPIDQLWDVCGVVAKAVARQAVRDGVATVTDAGETASRLSKSRWIPRYPKIVLES